MVKVTTSMIDVYSNVGVFPREFDASIVNNNNNNITNNNNAPRTVTAVRRPQVNRHYRSHSLDASGFLGDSSSDSDETSFFDDSDDNDEVTAFFGRQGKELGNGLHRGEITTKDVRDNNKINEIWRKASKRSHMNKTKSIDYGMLVSPRMTRKQGETTTKTTAAVPLNRSSTTDEAIYNSPRSHHVRNFSVPDLTAFCNNDRSTNNNNNKNKDNSRPSTRSPSPTEDDILQRNSYLLSPRLKRKQIDITKSSAYKEIYAHNLRLYSAVLAKQIATTGQVGREMNEIRRNKLKERALKPEAKQQQQPPQQQQPSQQQQQQYRRSKSFGNIVSAPAKKHENDPELRRSQSASSEFLRHQIQQCIPKIKDNESKQSSHEDLSKIIEEEDVEKMRARSQSLLPSKELIERMSTRIPSPTNNNNNNNSSSNNNNNNNNNKNKKDVITDMRDKRTIAAHKRKELVQKKLDSFDLMFGKTTDFLTKVRTMRK